MDIFQLECFRKVAEFGTGILAAKQMNISQTTLSRTISSLEIELGTNLFDRTGRKLVLNEHGKLFYRYALQGLDTLHYGTEIAKSVNKTIDGYIGISCIGFNGILSECVSRYCRENPNVTCRFIRRIPEKSLTPDSQYLNTDIFLNYSTHGKIYTPDIFPVSKELFDDTYYLAVSDKYRKFPKDKKVLTPEDIKDFTFILMTPVLIPDNASYQIWETIKTMICNSNPNTIFVKDFAQKLTFLANGTGASLLTAVCFPFAQQYDPSIRVFGIQGIDLKRKLIFSRRRKKDMSSQSLHFWEYLLKFFNLPIDTEE